MTANTTPATPNDPNTLPAGTTPTPTDNPAAGGDKPPIATDQTGTEAPKDEWENFDAERAKRTIENLRRIEAEQKKQLAERQAKLDEIEREKMSEAERAAADLKRLQDEAAEALRTADNARIDAALTRAGIPESAMIAARAVIAEVAESDEAGRLTISDTVIEQLRTDHGYLFGLQAEPRPDISFGAASQGQSGTNKPELTADQIAFAQRAGVDPAEFAKYASRTVR